MAKKTCNPDTTLLWGLCHPFPPESQPVKWSSDVPPQYDPAVSPAVWISVVVVVNGSILAMFLRFIIYKMQARHNHTAGEPEAGLIPPAVDGDCTAAVVQREEEAPPSCPQLNSGPQTCFRQEVSTYSGASGCGSLGEVGGMFMCNGLREHWIPLPATELGDAALVTTKTVQCSD
uniref:Uncharacterized protein n=1 Tax=Oncorhynchus tshawytscha TaxID=74940 RepID=A0AAZ3QDQ6_ONCTS